MTICKQYVNFFETPDVITECLRRESAIGIEKKKNLASFINLWIVNLNSILPITKIIAFYKPNRIVSETSK
ncbi:hypothetical protein BpHYR1_052464 [Brachionus plicatilis]|uniref:Uncharacterized protein n=1 Tax=Brachionus plicatilis TaxID=10195 RepID=A0A3M7PFG4_BRAPC|nr:hypothetical protein BpHYR1_052464 [Brachionus plicatilis]